jgi:hypothetical protein
LRYAKSVGEKVKANENFSAARGRQSGRIPDPVRHANGTGLPSGKEYASSRQILGKVVRVYLDLAFVGSTDLAK